MPIVMERPLTKPPAGTLVNAGHPSATSLVNVWPLNEGGGLATREMVRGNPGLLSGATPPFWRSGAFGPQLSFSGATAYVNTASVSVPLPMTMLMFGTPSVKLNGALGRTIMSHDSGANDGYRIAFVGTDVGAGTHLGLTFGAVNTYEFTSLTPTVGIPMFFAVTADANGGTSVGYLSQGYASGLSRQALAIGSMTGTPSRVTLSSNLFTDAADYAGTMDFAAHYHRVLAAEELQTISDNLFGLMLQAKPTSRLLGLQPPPAGGAVGAWRALLGVGL